MNEEFTKSGRQRGEANIEAFKQFIIKREKNKDWEVYISPGGYRLVSKKIYKECKFGRSALSQNPRLKKMLVAKEAELIDRGIIKKPTLRGLNLIADPGDAPDEKYFKAIETRLDDLMKVIADTEKLIIEFEDTSDRYADLAKPYLEQMVKPVDQVSRKKRRRKR